MGEREKGVSVAERVDREESSFPRTLREVDGAPVFAMQVLMGGTGQGTGRSCPASVGQALHLLSECLSVVVGI